MSGATPETCDPSRTPRGVFLRDASETEQAGRSFGRALETVPGRRHTAGAIVVGLAGGLGTGKTTFARASLRALGVGGTVRSPTYTIAEPYETRIGSVWHLDLYRMAAPEELHYIAIRDLVSESAACLVEWPERGKGELPELDCLLAFAPAGSGRRLESEWFSARGSVVVCRLHASMRRELNRCNGPGS